VTGRVIVLSYESGGSTEEGIGSGSNDDTLSLSLLAGRGREALVSDLLVDGKRLAGKTSLIDRNVDGIVETAIGGDNVTDLERDNVTGNEVGCLNLLPLAVAADFALWCERFHERLDGVSGIALFDETDL
jgi:hypothetical protein